MYANIDLDEWPKCLYRAATTYDYWYANPSPMAQGRRRPDRCIGSRLVYRVCFLFWGKAEKILKALEEKILKEGTVLPGGILKVGSFLNHQIDTDFTMQMGQEIARLFADAHITRVLTIETSGIAIAFAAAFALHVPMVFAKKARTGNLSGELYQVVVHSYTHGVDYHVVVEKQLIRKDDRVLLVDDFLANGKAVLGLSELVHMAGAEVVGAAVAIAKGFQGGVDALRAKGLRVEALATIAHMEDGAIVFGG